MQFTPINLLFARTPARDKWTTIHLHIELQSLVNLIVKVNKKIRLSHIMLLKKSKEKNAISLIIIYIHIFNKI